MIPDVPSFSFALIAPRFDRFTPVVRALFEHPWVASYQIGFGPPLVKANLRLVEAVRASRSAFEKLDAYVTHCLLDAREQSRLAHLHRQLLVRRHGPIEAEEAALRGMEALDLSLRLFGPREAPAHVQMDSFPPAVSPEILSARLFVRLDDPRGERLLDLPVVSAAVPVIAAFSGEPMVLELRVRPEAAALWRAYGAALAASGRENITVVELGDPAAAARVIRDGQSS